MRGAALRLRSAAAGGAPLFDYEALLLEEPRSSTTRRCCWRSPALRLLGALGLRSAAAPGARSSTTRRPIFDYEAPLMEGPRSSTTRRRCWRSPALRLRGAAAQGAPLFDYEALLLDHSERIIVRSSCVSHGSLIGSPYQ